MNTIEPREMLADAERRAHADVSSLLEKLDVTDPELAAAFRLDLAAGASASHVHGLIARRIARS